MCVVRKNLKESLMHLYRSYILFLSLCIFSCSSQAQSHGPKNGSLIIMGGGSLDAPFYARFMDLIGGPDAEIVVIPTAIGGEGLEDGSIAARLVSSFKQQGFTQVTVLHTTDREEAQSEAFVKPLTTAKGIWFTGGRQWRLADSYLGTRSQEEFNKLLERGGVIAGSSAGATIQGSYLARGDSKTNTIMMGDHEEGFGFVSNVAIDQHVLARNRQFDLFEILDHHPDLLGIGIDENTGILVQGDQFEVMGASYVLIYDGTMWHPETQSFKALPAGSREFYMLGAGGRYDLVERRVVEQDCNEDG